MIRLTTEAERKDTSRYEITATKDMQPLTECDGFPLDHQPIDPDNLAIIVDGVRHTLMIGFGLSFWYHNEAANSTIELYRAQPSDPFVVRIPMGKEGVE